MFVDLQERERVIEDMRMALTEQEETQTQLDLELESREAEINELSDGMRLQRPNSIHKTQLNISQYCSRKEIFVIIYSHLLCFKPAFQTEFMYLHVYL